jgi:hypothetical protein
MVDEKDVAVEKWLKDAGHMDVTGALSISGDYPGIVCIVSIGAPYRMIGLRYGVVDEWGGCRIPVVRKARRSGVDELAMQQFIQTRRISTIRHEWLSR